MEAKAVGKYLRVTPRKAKFVLDVVRGKSVDEALAMLKFIPNEAARFIEKVLESAAANAEHNYAMDREILKISGAFADGGPVMKRVHPRSMGRAYRILKRTSHITVVVAEDEKLRKAVVKPKGRKVVGKKETVAKTVAPAKAKAAPKAKAKVAAPKAEATAEKTTEKTEE